MGRSPPLGGLQEKQEAASAPWEDSWLPGKIQLTDRKSLISQTMNSLNAGYAFNLLGLGQQKCSVVTQRLNEFHS